MSFGSRLSGPAAATGSPLNDLTIEPHKIQPVCCFAASSAEKFGRVRIHVFCQCRRRGIFLLTFAHETFFFSFHCRRSVGRCSRAARSATSAHPESHHNDGDSRGTRRSPDLDRGRGQRRWSCWTRNRSAACRHPRGLRESCSEVGSMPYALRLVTSLTASVCCLESLLLRRNTSSERTHALA